MKLKDNCPNFKHRPKGENSAKLGTTVFMLKMWLHRVGVDATQTFFFKFPHVSAKQIQTVFM
jgi:hypothetical protein